MRKIRKALSILFAFTIFSTCIPCSFAISKVDVVDSKTFIEYVNSVSDMAREQDNMLECFFDEELENEYVTCRVLVKAEDVKELSLESFSPEKIVYNEDDSKAVIQFDTPEEAKSCVEIMKSVKGVEYAEPDRIMKIQSLEKREILPAGYNALANNILSWGVSYIHADTFSKNLKNLGYNKEIVVAVVDTGVDLDHPFLSGRVLDNGYDFVYGDTDPSDVDGHGTHVSGTIVDVTGDLNVKILPVRCLDDDGYGETSQIAEAIVYAANQGADVINLSLGGPHESNAMDDAVKYAISKGVLVCVAAGNEDEDTSNSCPAHMSEPIVVSAIGSNGKIADFSNYGYSVDFCAPGVGISSSYNGGGYATLSGTSMATPHIAGVCAMLRLRYPEKSVSEIEEYMASICTDLGSAGKDVFYGYGTIDFNKSVQPHDHIAGNWEVLTETTCTQNGEDVKRCTVCGEIMERRTNKAPGHSMNVKDVEPSCTEAGGIKHYCENCSYFYLENEIPALGHKYGEEKIAIAPTCTKKGISVKVCSVCNDTIVKSLDKYTHSFTQTYVPATCDNPGYTLHQCKYCSASYMTDYTQALPHTAGEWVSVVPSTESCDGISVLMCSCCNCVMETKHLENLDYTFEEKSNSSVVIDDEKGIIYGIEEGTDDFESLFETENCTVSFLPTQFGNGTGSTINVLHNGVPIKSYKLVVFGDVDGDGFIDSFDYSLMSLAVNHQCPLSLYQEYAADLTGDGYVDAFDLSLEGLADVYSYTVRQSR